MNAVEILNNLTVFLSLLGTLYANEILDLTGQKKLNKELTISYDFVTLNLYLTNSTVQDNTDRALYCRVVFKMEKGKAVLEDFHCEDKSRAAGLEKLIYENKSISDFTWGQGGKMELLNKGDVVKYLLMADAIACQALNCATGDNYRPGNFSEILLDDEKIVLQQINRMNSRSLDHQDDYSMRDLEFTIPLNAETKKSPWDHQIGEMQIKFSDGSSANNTQCGKAIEKQIEIQKKEFENSATK